MATIKLYTDIEQSKKLAEILPIGSADMYTYKNIFFGALSCFNGTTQVGEYVKLIDKENKAYPCWSLVALLEQLPYELCDNDGYSTYLQINKDDDMYQLEYIDPSEIFESIETDRYENFVDACYELILKLHELNLL